MSYISSTNPGVTRGPHKHADQADHFCFIGPSNFKLRMWDNRPESTTYRNMMTLVADEDDPQACSFRKASCTRIKMSERWTAL
jgi:dTDP-4-dehydrorhamnose 3,5-epimerase